MNFDLYPKYPEFVHELDIDDNSMNKINGLRMQSFIHK